MTGLTAAQCIERIKEAMIKGAWSHNAWETLDAIADTLHQYDGWDLDLDQGEPDAPDEEEDE